MGMADVYERLGKFLDNLPAGFPPSESGVEQRILRRLFTPEEAELAMHLTLLPEEARVIARRARMPVEEVAHRLREMEKKGLVFALHEDDKPAQYMATQVVIGFFEYQVNKLDPELVRDFEEYLPVWFDADLWQKAPQMRTIPIGESIDPELEIMAYEQAESLVRAQGTFSVAPCICRQEQQVLGQGCGKPLETCLAFGKAADYYLHNAWGRAIDQAEAVDLLRRAEEEGLVLQPGNSKDGGFICMCCGCCCGILRGIKNYPKPASLVSTPFYAEHEDSLCDGCGICETRCQMEAIRVDNGKARLDLDRCIGCGLCVTTCPTNALRLVRKPAEQQRYVPRDIVDTNIRLAQARGRLGTPELVRMMVRSKVDRLLARM
jgi:Na+-translocating ferredoxin:NAD+ oxidoreductase subunit B